MKPSPPLLTAPSTLSDSKREGVRTHNSDRNKGREPVCYVNGCQKKDHSNCRKKLPIRQAFPLESASDAWVVTTSSPTRKKYHQTTCEQFWSSLRDDTSTVRYRTSAVPTGLVHALCCTPVAPSEASDSVFDLGPEYVHDSAVEYEQWMSEKEVEIPGSLSNRTVKAWCTLIHTGPVSHMRSDGSYDRSGNFLVALDSYAAVCMASETLCHNIAQASAPLRVRGVGGCLTLTKCADVIILDGHGIPHIVLAYVAPLKHMPSGCSLLLSATALAHLRVDLNWHLRSLVTQRSEDAIPRLRVLRSAASSAKLTKHTAMPKFFTPPSMVEEAREEIRTFLARSASATHRTSAPRTSAPRAGASATRTAVPRTAPTRSELSPPSDERSVAAIISQFGNGDSFEEVFITEAMFRSFNERKLTHSARKTFSLADITIPAEEPARSKVQVLMREFADRFAKHDGEPPALNVEPYKILLKSGAVLPLVKKPNWPPAQEEYWRRWATAALAEGERVPDGGWERAPPNCRTASRPIAVLKTGPSGLRPELDPDFDVRPCGAYVEINDCCEPEPTEAPDREKLVRRFGLFKLFFGTDGISSYRQVLLHEDSRDLTALWTPIGIIRSRRLVFGMKNAGTVLGRIINELMNELPTAVREAFKNFADDFRAGGHDIDDLLEKVRAFLLLCRKYGVTLKPPKTFVGTSQAEFVGYLLKNGLISVSPENLRPIATLEPPRDVSALRRVLGLFVQSRNFVPDYGVKVQPLTKLTGSVRFEWGTIQQRAFDELKSAILAAPALHMPDFTKPFCGRSDASDYGVGGYIYQLSETGATCVVKYVSAPYKPSMLHKPTFYKEAWAVVFVISAGRVYISMSPFVYTHGTDHAPLRWMKLCLKGPISAWIAESIGDLQFRIEYVKGPENIVADALSRFPVVSYGTSTFLGLSNMFKALLSRLGPSVKSASSLWVWASHDTVEMARLVQAWRTPANAILARAPKSAGEAWDCALLAPPPESASTVCRALIATGKPFACLVPSDLVNWVAVGASRLADVAIQRKIDSAVKLSFMDSGLTWVVCGCGIQHDVVFAVEDLGSESVRAHWAKALSESKAGLEKKHGTCLVERSDGLLMLAEPGRPALVIVPEAERSPLMAKVHASTGHAAAKRTLLVLRQSFYWEGMSSDVQRFVAQCECVASKAKRTLAHGVWRAVTYDGPGDALGIDFYGVARSDGGFTIVVALVDLFSRWRKFVPLLNRQASEVVRAILDEWVYQRGCPTVLVSDADPAILGSVVQGLLRALDIKHMRTQYHPEGNSIVERGFVLLGECLRRMPKETRPRWPSELQKISFAANTRYNASIGMSPFEADCGRIARQPFDSQFVEPGSIELDERKCVGLYGRLAAVTAMYRQAAADVSKAASSSSVNRLNAKGSGPVNWQVGDLVFVYAPPKRSARDMAVASDGSRVLGVPEEGKEPAWKVKHTIHWRGPCVVCEKVSASTYRVKERSSGKVFERHVSLIFPAAVSSPVSPAKTPEAVSAPAPEPVADNEIVAIVDEPGDKSVWLMRCLSTDNDELQGHFEGSEGNEGDQSDDEGDEGDQGEEEADMDLTFGLANAPRKRAHTPRGKGAPNKKLRFTLSPQSSSLGGHGDHGQPNGPDNPHNSNPNAMSVCASLKQRKCGIAWCRQPGHNRTKCTTEKPADWDEKKKAPRYLVLIIVCSIVIRLSLICIEIGITIIVSTVQSIREKYTNST